MKHMDCYGDNHTPFDFWVLRSCHCSWTNSSPIFLQKGHEELDAASLREHEEFTKVKNIAKIELGRYEIDTWYFSPFPPEYNDSSKLYFCEFCLNFMKRKEQLQRHMVSCIWFSSSWTLLTNWVVMECVLLSEVHCYLLSCIFLPFLKQFLLLISLHINSS